MMQFVVFPVGVSVSSNAVVLPHIHSYMIWATTSAASFHSNPHVASARYPERELEHDRIYEPIITIEPPHPPFCFLCKSIIEVHSATRLSIMQGRIGDLVFNRAVEIAHCKHFHRAMRLELFISSYLLELKLCVSRRLTNRWIAFDVVRHKSPNCKQSVLPMYWVPTEVRPSF